MGKSHQTHKRPKSSWSKVRASQRGQASFEKRINSLACQSHVQLNLILKKSSDLQICDEDFDAIARREDAQDNLERLTKEGTLTNQKGCGRQIPIERRGRVEGESYYLVHQAPSWCHQLDGGKQGDGGGAGSDVGLFFGGRHSLYLRCARIRSSVRPGTKGEEVAEAEVSGVAKC